jgi:hypothetical protein
VGAVGRGGTDERLGGRRAESPSLLLVWQRRQKKHYFFQDFRKH